MQIAQSDLEIELAREAVLPAMGASILNNSSTVLGQASNQVLRELGREILLPVEQHPKRSNERADLMRIGL